MDRKGKEEFVISLQRALTQAGLVVVTHVQGLTVAEISDLRCKMRDGGAFFKVTKNTLARLAVKGTKFEGINPFLGGPTALAHSEDVIAAAKIAVKFANSNEKLKVIGGCLNGELLDAAAVKRLAELPSLDELRGKLVGVIVAPASRIATISQAPAAQLARVFNAYATKSNG